MYVVGRKIRRLRQVELPEPVIPNDLPGPSPTFRGEIEHIALETRQAVAPQFHAQTAHLLHRLPPPRRQLLQRDARAREAIDFHDVVHRLQGVLATRPSHSHPSPPEPNAPAVARTEQHRQSKPRTRRDHNERARRQRGPEKGEKRPRQPRRTSQHRRVKQHPRETPRDQIGRGGGRDQQRRNQHDTDGLQRDHDRGGEQKHEGMVHRGGR